MSKVLEFRIMLAHSISSTHASGLNQRKKDRAAFYDPLLIICQKSPSFSLSLSLTQDIHQNHHLASSINEYTSKRRTMMMKIRQ